MVCPKNDALVQTSLTLSTVPKWEFSGAKTKRSLGGPRQDRRVPGESLAPLNRPGSDSRERRSGLARCHSNERCITAYTGEENEFHEKAYRYSLDGQTRLNTVRPLPCILGGYLKKGK